METTWDKVTNSSKAFFGHPVVLGIVTLVLILFGSLGQQQLPRFMYRLFDSNIFKFLIIMAVAVIAAKGDYRVAFVVALIFVVGIQALNYWKLREHFESELKIEEDPE
jgi:hypothetical protein